MHLNEDIYPALDGLLSVVGIYVNYMVRESSGEYVVLLEQPHDNALLELGSYKQWDKVSAYIYAVSTAMGVSIDDDKRIG